MHIQALRIRNFRRLKNARIDLEKDISIFVGANNSGKTSAAHVIGLFLGDESDGLSVHDFSVDTWAQMDAFGNEQPGAAMPLLRARQSHYCRHAVEHPEPNQHANDRDVQRPGYRQPDRAEPPANQHEVDRP